MGALVNPDFARHEDSGLRVLVWVKGTPSVVSARLTRTLEAEFQVHRHPLPPAAGAPSAVVCCLEGEDDDVTSAVRSIKASAPDAAILVLGPSLDLPLIYAAVEAGARGFVHAGMPPRQVARAVSVVMAGETALPRELLEAWVNWLNEQREPDLSGLSKRQLEILELVVEGLSNVQIAKRLFLAQSTVKQHLRTTYKLLGVKNRKEARRIVLRTQRPGTERRLSRNLKYRR